MAEKAKRLKQFKGLAQHVAYEELSDDFCHTCVNLDVDNPVGNLTQRGGYTKKYTDNFTDIISAYEHYYEKADQTVLIFNDNGTLKRYIDGGSLASISTSGITTLESGFRNQYFGFKNHVLITAGNGSTNYNIGYYYLKRVNADNTGIFGNVEEFTGYKLLRSQLIFGNGVFSKIKDIVKIGNEYFISFQDSSIIEKRDSNLQLLERLETQLDFNASDGLCLTTDGTYLYIGGQKEIIKKDVDNWETLATHTEASNVRYVGLDYESTNVEIWAVNKAHATQTIQIFTLTFTLSANSDKHTASGDYEDIIVKSGVTTDVYILEGASGTQNIKKYTEPNYNQTNYAGATTYSTLTDPKRIRFTSGGKVVVTDYGADEVKTLTDALALFSTDIKVVKPWAFFSDSEVVSQQDGVIKAFSTNDITYPSYFGICYNSEDTSGDLLAGTYFYKISMVDEDGQESLLSDPIAIVLTAQADITLNVVANADELDYFYRLKSINVYRAYNSDQDAKEEATSYRLLKTIDINDSGWEKDANLDGYRFLFIDSITEDEISSVSYKENTGFSEDAKPRYINYKYHVWVENKLHIANFYHDGDDYPNGITQSQLNAPGVLSLDGFYQYDQYDGDEIKNLGEVYGRVIAFKQRQLGVFREGRHEKSFVPGIADTDSFFKVGDTIFFISDKGLHALIGNDVQNIRDSVTNSFNSISSFTDSTVFYFDNLDRIIFNFPYDRSFIFNKKHKTWVEYDSKYAFNGIFKNRENEYIAFGREPNGVNHNFFILDNDTQDNGENISITYESALLRLADFDGLDAEITKYYYRHISTGTYTLKIYQWQDGAKTARTTFTLVDPTGANFSVKTNYAMDGVWGEAFSVEITGTGTVFKFNSLTLVYEMAGITEDEI